MIHRLGWRASSSASMLFSQISRWASTARALISLSAVRPSRSEQRWRPVTKPSLTALVDGGMSEEHLGVVSHDAPEH